MPLIFGIMTTVMGLPRWGGAPTVQPSTIKIVNPSK
jgi:hypothetical protein